MKAASCRSNGRARKSRQLTLTGQRMTDLLQWGKEELKHLGEEEAVISAERLLEETLEIQKFQLYLDGQGIIPVKKVKAFRRFISLRRERWPVAYIVGRAYFGREVLEVGPECLIPRPETERIVEVFTEFCGYQKDDFFSFLDLGAGSGAIGIALLRLYPKTKATFSDFSEKALEYTKKNLWSYDLWKQAEVVRSDLFQAFYDSPKARRWNAILCNPPYLSSTDWVNVEPEILREPRVALDGKQDGLAFYRRLVCESENFLEKGGCLLMEVGQGQAEWVCKQLLERRSFGNAQWFKDYNGIKRIVASRLSY